MDHKIAYGTSTAITITLASLASSSYRESTAVDNTSNKFMDALLMVLIKSGAGAMGGEKVAKVFFYGSENGTDYTDNATGSDAAITPRSPTNLLGPYLVQMPTSAVTYKTVFPVAPFFNGIMPRKWGIVVQNASGTAFDTTGGNHVVSYTGIYQTIA